MVSNTWPAARLAAARLAAALLAASTVVAGAHDVASHEAASHSAASNSAASLETIRFVLTHLGSVAHEMVLGRPDALREQAAMMAKDPGMRHTEPNQASVAPGSTGVLVWRFTRAGSVDFACLQPGHDEAGMTGQVAVAAGRP